jgi:endonuclease/exonuclease/phosphatase family metal-dependent hydrolase
MEVKGKKRQQMLRRLKKFTIQLLVGANIGVILLLLLIGFSGHLDPSVHPRLSTLGLTFPAPLLINFCFLVFWLFAKPRYALVPFVGFVLAYVPVRAYFPLNVPHSAPEGAIKVISYNVEGFGFRELKGSNDSINPITAYLRDSKADIICLQEAGGHELRADSILKHFYPYTCFQMKDSSGDVLAVYSQYPIQRVERIDYPSRGNLSIACELDVNGRKVLLVNNHFETNGLEPEDKDGFRRLVKRDDNYEEAKTDTRNLFVKLSNASKMRAPQVDQVMRYISSRRGGKSVIALGDFNETPISYSQHRFAEKLTDCYAATANGPGFSYNRSHMLVRIDHIFCSDDFTPYACHVDRSVAVSDHYPVVCWLK